jgi:hypothetical protein
MSADQREEILKILDDQNHLSERADTKAISMLSMLGIFTVFFVAQLTNMTMNNFLIAVVVIYFVSVVVAILEIILAINPRTRSDKKTNIPKSDAMPTAQPTFFEGICKFENAEEYKKGLNSVINSDEKMTDIYISQIYQVAQINKTKYTCVRRAVWFVVIALASQLSIIAYIFARKT